MVADLHSKVADKLELRLDPSNVSLRCSRIHRVWLRLEFMLAERFGKAFALRITRRVVEEQLLVINFLYKIPSGSTVELGAVCLTFALTALIYIVINRGGRGGLRATPGYSCIIWLLTDKRRL